MQKKAADIITELSARIGSDKVSTSNEVLNAHSHDASSHPAVNPDVVVFPKTTNDISAILAYAHSQQIPVTAFGKGTSLEGNSIPVQKGISLDLTHMKKVLKVYKSDFQVVVEPGIIGSVLNEALDTYGLNFPAFPASFRSATIGGMIANNAGGMYAVKYGVVGDWVLQLEVVLADGSVITVGSRSIKTVSGYNLKRLFIGSEGTLGIISKATLRVIPKVKNKLLLVLSFPSVTDALNATLEMLAGAVDPAAVEYLDKNSIHFINLQKDSGWKEVPTLLVELHGILDEMDTKIEIIKKIGSKNKVQFYTVARSDAEQRTIWETRSSVHPVIMANFPNCGIVPGDIGVPISQISQFMHFVEKTTQKRNSKFATFGHIGDGNFHVWLIFDKNDPNSLSETQKIASELVHKSLELGGTSTAEHGIGIGKRAFLQKEHPENIYYMQQVKKIFDPNSILNPGKIFL